MKLTFYLAINEGYIDFARVFLYSLRKNFPEKKLKKIIINDLGLAPEQRADLRNFHPKIEYISTIEEKILSEGIWSDSWRLAINNKTEGLDSVCKEENYPILMIDADTYILEDFSEEIFYGCDVQVCTQEPAQGNEPGTLDYIGCWFVAHNDKAKEFIRRWRSRMKLVNREFRETPALCEVMSLINDTNNTHFTIRENHEEDICSVRYTPKENYNKPKILHFRSNPSTADIPEGQGDQFARTLNRTNYISDLPDEIKALFYRTSSLSLE